MPHLTFNDPSIPASRRGPSLEPRVGFDSPSANRDCVPATTSRAVSPIVNCTIFPTSAHLLTQQPFPTSQYQSHHPPTMAQMAAEERIALIRENLAETLDFDIIEKIINDGNDPKVYWGT